MKEVHACFSEVELTENGSPLFQAMYNIKKKEKQTINSTYLVSVGCGKLAEGNGHETVS